MIRFDCRLARPDFMLEAAFATEGGITALFGPSGSGKSTIIRLIAGLETPDPGLVRLDGETLTDTGTRRFVPPHRRRIGLVFQDARLLPHLSVRGNLGYGRLFTPRAERRISLDAVVDVLGIGHLLARRPATLSGGEQQRVAIGRALLASPRLLLLDEPLASLDQARKSEILPFIERLRDEFDVPMIYVSHAVEEVARLASRIVQLENGRVRAIGTPAEVLPPLPGRGTSLDPVSRLDASVRAHLADAGITLLAHPAGEIAVPILAAPPGTAMRVVIPAGQVTLAIGPPVQTSIRTRLAGRITAIDNLAEALARVTLALPGGQLLTANVTRLAVDSLGLAPGQDVQALVHAAAIEGRGPDPSCA